MRERPDADAIRLGGALIIHEHLSIRGAQVGGHRLGVSFADHFQVHASIVYPDDTDQATVAIHVHDLQDDIFALHLLL